MGLNLITWSLKLGEDGRRIVNLDTIRQTLPFLVLKVKEGAQAKIFKQTLESENYAQLTASKDMQALILQLQRTELCQ